MPTLKKNPSFIDFQTYVRELEVERGFTEDTRLHKCLMLGEEVGELCEAVREYDPLKSAHEVAGELTDVLIFLLSIANRLERIDLEAAIRGKLLPSIGTGRLLSGEAYSHPMTFTELQQLTVLTGESASDICLKLVENIGHLFKSIRKIERLKVDHSSKFMDLNEKLADIILNMCYMANHFDINIEVAFREKEKINKKRSWLASEITEAKPDEGAAATLSL